MGSSGVLNIYNYCISHFNETWRDNKRMSQPETKKFVRSARPKDLKRIHRAIDRILLKPYDDLILPCIYGGLSEKSHILAARSLMRNKGKRSFLKLVDLSRFFEQVSRNEVFGIFYGFGCSKSVANQLANICCVPKGPKSNPENEITLARGFGPSTRLAVWVNHKFFLEVWNLVRKRLKGHQPCIAVYVDDIGISAIDVRKEQLERLYEEIVSVSVKHGLALNHEKREICGHDEYQEFVGIRLNKRRVSVGKKALSKEKRLRSCITDSQYSNEEKKGFRSSLKGLY
jgi:hypothetical protein